MNEDNKAPTPSDDKSYDPQTHRAHSRYDAGLYNNDPNIDDLKQEDLLPETSEMDAGLAPDAFFADDESERTLTSDDYDEITGTGLNEIDGENLANQDNLGDIVMNPEDYVNDADLEEDTPELADEDVDE